MNEIPEVVIGTKDGEPITRRVMTAEQILERAQWNVEVTATRMAARAAAVRNGHSNGHAKIDPRALIDA